MPPIPNGEWRDTWLKKFHISLYPAFDPLVQQSLPLPTSNWLYIDLANQTIRDLKTLLLFHDFLDVSPWRLFIPLNPRAKNYFTLILDNQDFIGIWNNGLLATPVWYEMNFVRSCYNLVDEARNVFGAHENLSLLDHLHKLSSTRMLTYHATSDDLDLNKRFFSEALDLILENTFEFDRAQQDALLPIYTVGGDASAADYWYAQNSISRRISPFLSDEKIRAFYSRTSLSTYELGDRLPHRLPVPFLGPPWGDSAIRITSPSRHLAILRSPEFMRHFLNIFIDEYIVRRVGLLSCEDICDLHTQPFWRGFLEDYHSASTMVSQLIVTQPEASIVDAATDEFKRVMTKKLKRSLHSAEFLVGALFSLLSLLHVPRMPFPTSVKEWAEKLKGQSHMYLAHPDFQRFLSWVEKRLKSPIRA